MRPHSRNPAAQQRKGQSPVSGQSVASRGVGGHAARWQGFSPVQRPFCVQARVDRNMIPGSEVRGKVAGLSVCLSLSPLSLCLLSLDRPCYMPPLSIDQNHGLVQPRTQSHLLTHIGLIYCRRLDNDVATELRGAAQHHGTTRCCIAISHTVHGTASQSNKTASEEERKERGKI